MAGVDHAALDPRAARPPADYDPIALARRSIGRASNLEANVPPVCYARTEGVSNSCASCHTHSTYPNLADDWELQQNYSFSPYAKINHWKNLFRDRAALVARFSDDDVRTYVRGDNYAPLRSWLQAHADLPTPKSTSTSTSTSTPTWRPDLDFDRGFDEAGFAKDGSGWRAVRYKPFPGAFWAANGSADDVFVRLPEELQRDAAGRRSRATTEANLAILEANITADPTRPQAELVRAIEPVDERGEGVDLDLDGDGRLGVATTIVGLPARYAGATGVKVVRGLYPRGTEFLHTVRYLDPQRPGFAARRMKEVRYMRKVAFVDGGQLGPTYAAAESGRAPAYEGDPLHGLRNAFGWQLQGWIEDSRGWLRLQTNEEQRFCMGCHTALGVTVDQTFALARKLPGLAGWRPQDPRGIPDVAQAGHHEPEYADYLARVGGGDELRRNDELRERFYRAGVPDRASVAAVKTDIGALVLPSRARAIALDRAYLANVLEQSYVWGRDAVIAPARNVHATIVERSTGLGENNRTVRDSRLQLDWSRPREARPPRRDSRARELRQRLAGVHVHRRGLFELVRGRRLRRLEARPQVLPEAFGDRLGEVLGRGARGPAPEDVPRGAVPQQERDALVVRALLEVGGDEGREAVVLRHREVLARALHAGQRGDDPAAVPAQQARELTAQRGTELAVDRLHRDAQPRRDARGGRPRQVAVRVATDLGAPVGRPRHGGAPHQQRQTCHESGSAREAPHGEYHLLIPCFLNILCYHQGRL